MAAVDQKRDDREIPPSPGSAARIPPSAYYQLKVRFQGPQEEIPPPQAASNMKRLKMKLYRLGFYVEEQPELRAAQSAPVFELVLRADEFSYASALRARLPDGRIKEDSLLGKAFVEVYEVHDALLCSTNNGGRC
jgi:hypothetical protein